MGSSARLKLLIAMYYTVKYALTAKSWAALSSCPVQAKG